MKRTHYKPYLTYIYIGIDPGMSGAMALMSIKGTIEVWDFEQGECLQRLKDLGQGRAAGEFEVKAVLEKAHSMPKQGVSTTFKFGTNYGTWIGRLEACGIPFDLITPAKWKKEMFDSMVRSADLKAMSLDRARRLFPQMANRLTRKMDHNRAEALLLAEYCRRIDV